MIKGNVLVIGNSGVGKSTLINAVLGDNLAETGWGLEGTTNRLDIFENDAVPFRIIDSVGFEPNPIKKIAAVNAIRKWSHESTQNGKEDRQINLIWFCIDGTSRKLFSESIKSLSTATKMWNNVPIIVVITKSYSIPERAENIKMVENAFARQKQSKNLRYILPVVAETYVINDNAYAPPSGIEELIKVTNDLMPEGIKAAVLDVNTYIIGRKKYFAQGLVGASTTAGVVVGAIPVPFADTAILAPIEAGLIYSIASIYGIKKDEKAEKLRDAIVSAGTVSAAAKATLSSLKAVPGLNIAASTLNAIVAGAFVAAVGEGSIYIFEQVYLGNKTVDDVDWVSKVIESKFSSDLVSKIVETAGLLAGKSDSNSVVKAILSVFSKK
ncbi:MAG: GTP-binding DUF697 domain-containing protein [Lachnospiraceae bacterium]|nr:GTP-binding DUF697 domain-containing protein [Lachnospiraceae bacterium]